MFFLDFRLKLKLSRQLRSDGFAEAAKSVAEASGVCASHLFINCSLLCRDRLTSHTAESDLGGGGAAAAEAESSLLEIVSRRSLPVDDGASDSDDGEAADEQDAAAEIVTATAAAAAPMEATSSSSASAAPAAPTPAPASSSEFKSTATTTATTIAAAVSAAEEHGLPRFSVKFTVTHKAPVRAAAFRPDGQMVATGAEDGSVKLLDTSRMLLHHQMKMENRPDADEVRPILRTLHDHFAVNRGFLPFLPSFLTRKGTGH